MQMKFRTEIEVKPSGNMISYSSNILSLGSCFSERIAERMSQCRFNVTSNPLGVVFNPLSIARDIRLFAGLEPVSDPQCADGMWFSYDAHSSLSADDADVLVSNVASAVECGSRALMNADWVILTFGTAFVYELCDGRIVANCHRMPSGTFSRRRLAVDEIVSQYDSILDGPLSGKNVILTVSPVRHVGDTLTDNSVSKSILRLAADELCSRHAGVVYFPSFELLVDDLRDYRFYADDMVHPSSSAVEYIWEKFRLSFISPSEYGRMDAVQGIVRAASHRPLHPESDACRRFCCQQLQAIDSIPDIDLERERAIFSDAIGK